MCHSDQFNKKLNTASLWNLGNFRQDIWDRDKAGEKRRKHKEISGTNNNYPYATLISASKSNSSLYFKEIKVACGYVPFLEQICRKAMQDCTSCTKADATTICK